MSREERQKELLFRWVQFSLSRDEPIKELAEFQDGSLLTSLMEVLAKKKAPYRIQKGKNKLTVVGNLQNTLKFIEAQRVRVTCSPNELYDLNENMLFGLLWVLILKYQVQQKANILAWAALLTEKPLSKHARARVKDFDASWQDGLAFALLVNAIEPRTIDVSAIGADNRNGLVRASFDAATGLGIPQLLNVDDSKFDERGILTYLSYFYNKYSHVLPQDEPDPELELLRAKVMELMTRVTEAESKLRETEETSQQLIIKTTNDLRELMEQQEDMQSQLEESKEFTQTVNKKIQELTLKMPFYNNSGQSATPPPKGEVTLVFTDVQSSTDQWEKRPDAMAESLRLHNEIMREIIGEYKGYEVKTEGDAFMIAFASSENAVNWCLETQQRLMTVDWPEAIYEGDPAKPEQDEDGKEIYRGLRVRMGVHTGKPKAARDPVNGRMDYFGPMVNRSARVEGSANGGQIILSGETWDSIQEPLKEGAFGDVVTKDLGNHRLKGLQTDTRLMQILPAGLATRTFPDIKSPEAEEKANLEKQFEALQMNNKELKVRFVTLEEEAQEAMKKAAEFQKWLQEQGDKFPKSLADELAIMGNNVKTLMRSQRNLMKELLRAQERAEISDAEMHGLKERLEQSLDTEGDLRKKLIEVTEECDTLDSSCTSYRTKLAELEKLLSSKDKPKGILRKLGVGGNKDKTIVAATTLLKSEETPEEVKTEVQSRRKSRHLAVGDMANLMEALEAQEAAEADGAEAGEEGAETAEKQGKNEPEEAEKSRDKKEGKKDVKKDAKKQYSKKDLNEQKEAAPAPAPAPEAGQDAKKANMKKRTSMKFVGKVLSRKKPADADANEDKAAKKERAAGEKAAKKEKADEEKAARKEKAEGEKAAKKEKADDNKAVKKEKSAKNDSKQSKADSAEDASEERRALSEEEPEKKDKKEKKEKKEKKSKKEKKEKKKDNEESEQDNSVEEKEKMERREEKDEGSEKSGEEASVELNTDKKKAKKEKKGSHEKEGSAEEEDKKKKDKESEETDDKKDEKDEKKGKKKGKKKDKKDKEGSEEDEKVDKEKEDKEDKKHKHKHKKKEKHKKEGKDGEAEDEDD